jgi:NADPH-dependent 2,4-dienoyl-CoA reductase/sulfur reductase-like enzyme
VSEFELVIVGGGVASARAIRAYRDAGGKGAIALLSRDSGLPYHRPPLSKGFLRGEVEASETLVEPAEFYDRNRVALLVETEVIRVDAHRFETSVPGIYAARLANEKAAVCGFFACGPGRIRTFGQRIMSPLL